MKVEIKEDRPLPISLEMFNAKQAILENVLTVQKECGLPYFVLEGILADVLVQIQSGANNERTIDFNKYMEGIKEDYEKELQSLKGGE
jgi:hypothetical protein